MSTPLFHHLISQDESGQCTEWLSGFCRTCWKWLRRVQSHCASSPAGTAVALGGRTLLKAAARHGLHPILFLWGGHVPVRVTMSCPPKVPWSWSDLCSPPTQQIRAIHLFTCSPIRAIHYFTCLVELHAWCNPQNLGQVHQIFSSTSISLLLPSCLHCPSRQQERQRCCSFPEKDRLNSHEFCWLGEGDQAGDTTGGERSMGWGGDWTSEGKSKAVR